MTKVRASALLEALVAIAILSGIYLSFINILPINRPINSVKNALAQINSMLDQVVVVALEKQSTARIMFVLKDKNIHCVPGVFVGNSNGGGFEPMPGKILTFEGQAASIFTGKGKDWEITVGSDGFVRPLPVKLNIVEKDVGGRANEVTLDWLRGKLVFKK